MAFIFRHRDLPNAAQQLKRAGGVVTGLSAFALLWAAMGLVQDQGEKITAVLLVCTSLWGLATGVGLLRSQQWARLSMLVFHSLLCICGALAVVVLLIVGVTTTNTGIVVVQNLAYAMFFTAWFVLISLSIGVRGLRFFRRDEVRAHFRAAR